MKITLKDLQYDEFIKIWISVTEIDKVIPSTVRAVEKVMIYRNIRLIEGSDIAHQTTQQLLRDPHIGYPTMVYRNWV